MSFNYIQVMEVYNIFGEDVESMICYMAAMGGAGAYAGCSNRQKRKVVQ
jgi:hypothetical protein